ncbi:MAG: helix-turn-helix domain-containing protein [Clostridiaceae bacterium]
MRLSEIIDVLDQHFGIIGSTADPERFIVAVDPFKDEHQEVFSNILYVTREERLARAGVDLKEAIFVVTESRGLLNGQKNVIVLDPGYNPREVYGELKVFTEQNIAAKTIFADLYACLTLDDYLGPIMDKAFAYLENPIICYDHLHHIRSFRKNGVVANDLWEKDIELGHLNFNNMDEVSYLCLESLITKSELEFQIREDPCRAITIKNGNALLGFLAVLAHDRPFSAMDEKILQVVADIIAVKTSDESGTGYRPNENYYDLLHDLLDQKIKSRQTLNGLLKTRKWKTKRYNRVFVFMERAGQTREFLPYLRNRITAFHPAARVIPYQDHIVVLEEFDDPQMTPVARFIQDDFKSSSLIIGISEVFEELIDIHHYYRQAAKALDYSQWLGHDRTLNHHRDYILIDFLREACEHLNCREYLHPYVRILMEHDESDHTDFSKTLQYYLASNGSVAQCSKALNVHKNTVNYRINQIKELLGTDLSDHTENFHLQLSYQLMDMGHRLNSEEKL